MADYTVAISSDFFSAFAALPKTKQGRVMDFMSKFRSNPLALGMNYEKINDAMKRICIRYVSMTPIGLL